MWIVNLLVLVWKLMVCRHLNQLVTSHFDIQMTRVWIPNFLDSCLDLLNEPVMHKGSAISQTKDTSDPWNLLQVVNALIDDPNPEKL